MEYTVANVTRLDDAKRRAHEILNDLSASSQIAVFDTADDTGEDSDDWLTSGQLRSRIDGLRVRPANAPVNRQIERAYRNVERKRSATRYLHLPPLLVDPVPEVEYPLTGGHD